MSKFFRLLPYILVSLILMYADRLIGGHVLFIGWWVWLMFRRDYSVFLLLVFSLYHDVLWGYPLGLTGIMTLLLNYLFQLIDRKFLVPRFVLAGFIFIFCVILSMIDAQGKVFSTRIGWQLIGAIGWISFLLFKQRFTTYKQT